LTIQLFTRRDALRHTARRIGIAVSVTVVVGWLLCAMQLGTDPDATVRVGFVTVSVIVSGAIVAALLTGALTYRSALMMQELTLTRAELQQISCTDQLTGLLNRRGFDEAAASAIAKARDANLPVVALMCDIDHFKSINDEFGHEFGDKVLVQLSNVLRSFADDNGLLIARHGGEEFAALAIGADNEKILKCAEALRKICSRKISSDGSSAEVTISVGLTSPRRETDLPTIMRFADQALYLAKRRGRNLVVQVDTLADLIAA